MSNEDLLERLRSLLIRNAPTLEVVEAGERKIEIPVFDIYARDYLQAAETDLDQYLVDVGSSKSNIHLINCVASLKRALDCELDVFLGAYGLGKLFKKRNLKIEKKMEFLREAGVITSRSLTRFNNIRNRMEHEYEIPKVSDLELYFDLVSSIIATLERSRIYARFDYMLFETNIDDKTEGAFSFDYDFEKPRINIGWTIWEKNTELVEDEVLNCTLDDYKLFATLFRVMLLMIQKDNYVSSTYVARNLNS